MNNKVFVGGLSRYTTEPTVERVFNQVAKVKDVNLVLDRETGESKGFGFVEFFDEVSAQLATVKLKDTFIDKRRINVSLSKEKKPKPITPSSELSEQGVDTASVAPVAEQEAPNE